ncbi:hypothetical protein DACRYDRAFT_21129 [Dacryopinax primogenitus]|uniref:Large ribosomal subunit protein uL23m n=1 Tax=Dacryopinax primogenitus (strain DJM 731) TaxID=1858805 RepID=M5GEU1_DACPD|nr:uncharacterized protein DACRYDRAFT_21129 [Dacryopinax primogenitus]EJU03588.1 hypothetical protein DACRYDRAFT_21129 [Dacryopinax primogenitus]
MLLQALTRLEASSSRALLHIRPLPATCRRTYALKVPQPPAEGKEASPFTTSPRAVRLRRHRFGTGEVVEVDGVKMSDADHRRWQWLVQQDKIPAGVTLKAWLAERYAWRSRIRGVKYSRREPTTVNPLSDAMGGKTKVDADGKVVEGAEGVETSEGAVTEEELQHHLSLKPKEIVGQRIYMPNFIVRLVRNTTPPGKPYDPYMATFRIPRGLTKMDIKSYLWAVYGVETTFVRTENFISQIVRSLDGGKKMRMSRRTYKRALVGLVEPFYYPAAKEDMTTEERKEREQWEEENFQKTWMEKMQKEHQAKVRGWKPKGDMTGARSKILREILRRRAEREGLAIPLGSYRPAETAEA